MASCRSFFLSIMGAVYFCAFATYYFQYPGLLGEDGLLPSRSFWEDVRGSRMRQISTKQPIRFDPNVVLAWWTKGMLPALGIRVSELPKVELMGANTGEAFRGYLQFPTWLWFFADGRPGPQVDQIMDCISIFGLVLASMAVLGVHHVFVFALLYVNYLSLFLLGQRWLSFQWDIFLLETGAMMLLYCPTLSLRAKAAMPPGAWLLRLLIVKFMYMNGVVKVTAECPTWKHLTALEYHFASTCLPTSEAWIHHQLPPFVLRLGVAFMFFVELAAPFLMLCPIKCVRRIGVLFQAPLQIGILVTGNYNWFNIHTLALLLPVWDDDVYGDDTELAPLLCRLCTFLPRAWGRFWSSWLGSLLGSVGVCWFTVWCCGQMFEVKPILGGTVTGLLRKAVNDGFHACSSIFWEDHLQVVSSITSEKVSRFSSHLFSKQWLQAFFIVVGMSCVRYILAPLSQCRSCCTACLSLGYCILRAAICSLIFPALVICISPCSHLHHGATDGVPFAASVRPLEQALDPWHVSTSYGLFRRMTGVGRVSGGKGWGGLAPSVVEVPAVIVEGSEDGRIWKEIPFRYAPGVTTRRPRRTAPHQPRLDWQMWFAALGSSQQNPWFVHLLYKILVGSEPILGLLEVDGTPWPAAEHPPKYVRSWLYHYDFTRLNTPWAQGIPRAAVISINGTANSVKNHRSADKNEWWHRTRVREYTGAMGVTELRDIIQRHGWPVKKKQRSAAVARTKNCSSAHVRGRKVGFACEAVVALRERVSGVQWISGWWFETRVFTYLFGELASTEVFLDVHFTLIMSSLLALLIFRVLAHTVLSCTLRSCCGRQHSYYAVQNSDKRWRGKKSKVE